MTATEFSRTVNVDTLGETARRMEIAADAVECAALARRFGLQAIERLDAAFLLRRKGNEVAMDGALCARVVQSCVASGVPVEAEVEAPFDLIFRPEPEAHGEEEVEVELGAAELDVIFYDGAAVDVGEAVAETLLLNLDPYPRSSDADAALRAAGVKSEEEAGPFGALAGLRDKLGK